MIALTIQDTPHKVNLQVFSLNIKTMELVLTCDYRNHDLSLVLHGVNGVDSLQNTIKKVYELADKFNDADDYKTLHMITPQHIKPMMELNGINDRLTLTLTHILDISNYLDYANANNYNKTLMSVGAFEAWQDLIELITLKHREHEAEHTKEVEEYSEKFASDLFNATVEEVESRGWRVITNTINPEDTHKSLVHPDDPDQTLTVSYRRKSLVVNLKWTSNTIGRGKIKQLERPISLLSAKVCHNMKARIKDIVNKMLYTIDNQTGKETIEQSRKKKQFEVHSEFSAQLLMLIQVRYGYLFTGVKNTDDKMVQYFTGPDTGQTIHIHFYTHMHEIKIDWYSDSVPFSKRLDCTTVVSMGAVALARKGIKEVAKDVLDQFFNAIEKKLDGDN